MYDFNMSKPSETEKRAGLIREMFGSVGKDVWINQPLTLAVGATVTIGDGTYINSGMTFIDDYKITIGKGCLFGTNVTLCTKLSMQNTVISWSLYCSQFIRLTIWSYGLRIFNEERLRRNITGGITKKYLL